MKAHDGQNAMLTLMTVQNGHPVIIHPTAPSKDMEIILSLERQRRREERWPASDEADGAREEIAGTEPSADLSQLLRLVLAGLGHCAHSRQVLKLSGTLLPS